MSKESVADIRWLLLAVILLLGGGVRIWLCLSATGLNSDGFLYARVAQRMAEAGVLEGMKGHYVWPYYPVNCRLVSYPLLGCLLYHLTGDVVLSLRLVSALSGTALIALTYLVGKEVFGAEGPALAGAAVLGFEPEFVRASASVYREPLAALLFMGALLLLLRLLRDPDRWAWRAPPVAAVLFMGFLTRPEFALVAAVVVTTPLWWPGVEWRKRVLLPGLLLASLALLELPYALWLRSSTGHLLFNQWQVHRLPEVQQTTPVERFLRYRSRAN